MLQLQVTSILLWVSMAIGQITTPIANKVASTCGRTNCTVAASKAPIFSWEQKTFNTTIVAATVITIMNTVAKTSRITTIFNPLPDRYTLQPTNNEGTLTQRITYTHLGSTITSDLAFPTVFNGYIDTYSWNGTLNPNNDTSCLTAKSPSAGTFSTFPPQPTLTFPTYKHETTTITNDTRGVYYSAVTEIIQLGDLTRFYYDIAPIKSCTLTYVAPAIAHWTAQFLTHTSISYEGSGGITTPVPVPAQSNRPSPPNGPNTQPSAQQTSTPQPPPNQLTSTSFESAPKTTLGSQTTSAQNDIVMGSLINSVVNNPAVSSTNGVPITSTSSGGQSQIPSQKNSPGSSSVAITSTGVTNGVSFTSTYTTLLPVSNQLISSSVVEITSTGVTSGVSFTSIYTTLVPVSTQLVTSKGYLVEPCFISFLVATMGLNLVVYL